jgi:hypothetical protein
MRLQSRLFTVAILSGTSAFALDEYLPIPVRVMEIDVGVARTSIEGAFGDDWEKSDSPLEENPLFLPVQGKFGLVEDLEGSMAVNYIINDANGKMGLDRPVLALKYADSTYGVGGFISATLPIAFDDIMNAGNYATMTFGALYGNTWGSFGLLANASYAYNTEDDNNSKIDYVTVFAKPEYELPLAALAKKKQRLGLNLGLKYETGFNHVFSGASTDYKEMLMSGGPGFTYTLNRILSAELTSSFGVSGKNREAANSVSLNFYFTLEETLYNSLSG